MVFNTYLQATRLVFERDDFESGRLMGRYRKYVPVALAGFMLMNSLSAANAVTTAWTHPRGLIFGIAKEQRANDGMEPLGRRIECRTNGYATELRLTYSFVPNSSKLVHSWLFNVTPSRYRHVRELRLSQGFSEISKCSVRSPSGRVSYYAIFSRGR